MSKNNFFLISIVVIAIFLRFWRLGSVPISPDWDEVSWGYNTYSILNTGHDEYGKFLPVLLQSYNDFKPALYAYLSIIPIAILGLSLTALRFANAFFSVMAVITTYFLVKELLKRKDLALLSSFLLAISPWAIQFSRFAHEATVGVSFNLLTILFLLKGLKKPYFLFLSALFSALALYTYQSEKIFAPLLMILLVIIYKKELFRINKKYLLSFFAVGLLVALPMLFSIVKNPQSLNRAKSTSFVSDTKFFPHTAKRLMVDRQNNDYVGLVMDNRRVVYARQIIGAYLSHYDLNWLFVTGDLPRHHAPGMGLLYLWELPFLLFGIYCFIFSEKFNKKSKLLLLSWFLLAPIPASISNDVPQAGRTLNFLPTMQIFIAVGLISSISRLSNIRYQIANIQIKYLIFTMYFLFLIFNISYYLNQYFVQQNYFYSKDWQYGYENAIEYVNWVKGDYEKVVVSDETPLDQSYMFFLFYLKYPPAKYQMSPHNINNHNFDKFEFRKIDWEKDQNLENTLFVGRPTDFNASSRLLKTFEYLNGEDAIKIVKPLSSTF